VVYVSGVAGLISTSERNKLWEKTGAVISGPFCESWEIREMFEKEKPYLEFRIMGTAEYNKYRLPISDEELEQKIMKLADKIEAAFTF
jgi:hypothetical protein